MKSPWKEIKPLEPGNEYVVLASSIPARRYSSTGRLFRGASAVRKQLETTEGVIGFSLLARPLRKQYATLSVWADDPSLAAFAGASPHGELMTGLSPEMGPTKFVRWTIDGSDGLPSWNDRDDAPEVAGRRLPFSRRPWAIGLRTYPTNRIDETWSCGIPNEATFG